MTRSLSWARDPPTPAQIQAILRMGGAITGEGLSKAGARDAIFKLLRARGRQSNGHGPGAEASQGQGDGT